jgi:glycosyltransferase involved in cell wall biosynthesis
MNKCKLIIFSESSMNIGGQELQALQQMCSLSQAGFQTLLLCKPRSAIAKRAKDDGVAFQEIRFRNAFHLPSFRKVIRIIRDKKPSILICHGSHDALICALAAKWATFFYSQQTAIFRIKTFQHGYPLSFSYNHLFTATLTPSTYLRSKFLINPAIDSRKIKVLYPGIDFSRLAKNDDPLPMHLQEWLAGHPGPIIAHAAILRGEKGHSILLQALFEVKKTHPDIRYVIAGDGQEKPLLERMIGWLGLEENVFLAGILQNIAPLLKVSDIAVLPSLSEPLGMFQIEAQYLGVPTIASDAGGIPETIMHQKTGLMIKAGHVQQWTDAIVRILDHSDEAKRLAMAGREFVLAKFSLESNITQLIELIKLAVALENDTIKPT